MSKTKEVKRIVSVDHSTYQKLEAFAVREKTTVPAALSALVRAYLKQATA